MDIDDVPFRVPRARLVDTHVALYASLLPALEEVLSGPPTRGPEVRAALERAWCDVVEQRFACAVHSGTIGLMLALRACGVGPGAEVITVANSDVSTIAAIRHCGAAAVLCDVRESDYTIDPEQVEPLISARTRALVPVDLYGHPADVRALRLIADAYGLAIVEDACLAAGARDYGQPVGVWADVCVYSFAPYKPLGSLGNGAMVVTSSDERARSVRLLAGYGSDGDAVPDAPGHQHYSAEGFNVPLDPFQAALLLAKLPYLADWTKRRRAVVAAYRAGLAGTMVELPWFRADAEPTFRCYTVRVQRQAEAYLALRGAGIEVVLHYTPPLHLQPVYRNTLRGAATLPVTERLARQILCLPVAPDLGDRDIAEVTVALREMTTADGG